MQRQAGWPALADQMFEEYPTLAPAVVLRFLNEAAAAVALFDVRDAVIDIARIMVRNNCDQLAARDAELSPVIAAQRNGSADDDDRQPA